MNGDTKIILGIVGLTVLVIVFIVVGSKSAGKPPSASLIERDGVATGSSIPKAILVEFSDFQCPACKAAEPAVKAILERNSSQLKFIYRHFPLPQYSLALKAAQAAQAANPQGKFWLYKEKLFSRQENLKESDFTEIAKEIGLDLEQFKKDLNSEATITQVQRDLNDAKSLNLSGTPSFFINGEKISLSSFDDLQGQIEERLK